MNIRVIIICLAVLAAGCGKSDSVPATVDSNASESTISEEREEKRIQSRQERAERRKHETKEAVESLGVLKGRLSPEFVPTSEQWTVIHQIDALYAPAVRNIRQGQDIVLTPEQKIIQTKLDAELKERGVTGSEYWRTHRECLDYTDDQKASLALLKSLREDIVRQAVLSLVFAMGPRCANFDSVCFDDLGGAIQKSELTDDQLLGVWQLEEESRCVLACLDEIQAPKDKGRIQVERAFVAGLSELLSTDQLAALSEECPEIQQAMPPAPIVAGLVRDLELSDGQLRGVSLVDEKYQSRCEDLRSMIADSTQLTKDDAALMTIEELLQEAIEADEHTKRQEDYRSLLSDILTDLEALLTPKQFESISSPSNAEAKNE